MLSLGLVNTNSILKTTHVQSHPPIFMGVNLPLPDKCTCRNFRIYMGVSIDMMNFLASYPNLNDPN